MELKILGAFEVFHEGRPLPLAGAKPKAVLAILALHANEIVSSDRLAEELWNSPPDTARATLQVYVAQLRKLFDPERSRGEEGRVLLTRAPGYLLQIAPDQLDSHRFERLLRDGSAARAAGDAAAAAVQLREGLSLWRGPALADFAYEPFAQAEIARLEELRLAALEERIEADLALGVDADLTGELESLISDHPLRERLCAQLMLTLYRGGRQADALDAYMAAHRALDEQLGLTPGPALQRLQEQILRHDPALDGGPGPAAPTPPRRVATRETRRTVTVLVAAGAAEADLDPEAVRQLYARHRAATSRAIEAHGGTVDSVLADRVMGIFGVPRIHEDDPLRAARAAVELLGDAARVGIATGQVVTSESTAGEPSVAGEPVTVAAELANFAPRGQVLLSDRTRTLLDDRVRAERAGPPDSAWRLLDVVPAPPPLSRLAHPPIVGRAPELAEIHAALERVSRDRDVRLVTLIGPAGIGKTRLAEEFVTGLGQDAAVTAGRCVAYGQGITFWPLRDIVASLTAEAPLSDLLAAEDDADVVEKLVTEAIGASAASSSQEEIFWAFRRLLESVARDRPLVVLIEDAHWAEPALLDFVDSVASQGHGPMVLLCLARPELIDARPGWGSAEGNLTPVILERLSPAHSAQLADNTAPAIPEATRARAIETADGNPLFLEQMLTMLAEGTADEDDELLPATIQAVVATRLDRLGPGEHAALDTAAVLGKEFPERAVAELLPEDAQPFASRHLEALVHKELLDPTRSPLGDAPAFRFRHVLIQQVAYGMVPKARRATLHERVADWLEQSIGPGTAEHAERGGHHLEKAYGYRAELGPLSDSDRDLARRAAALLATAGKRALERGDMPAAANLLGRTVSLVGGHERTARELLPDLGYALFAIGELEQANTVLSEAVEQGRARGDRRLEWNAAVKLAHVRMYTHPEAVGSDALVHEANRAIDVLTAEEDDLGLCRACTLLSEALFFQGKMAAAAEACMQAAEHAHRAGSPPDEAWALGACAMALLLGPMPPTEATRRTERLLRDHASGLSSRTMMTGWLACHLAMSGRLEEARALSADSCERLRDLGLVWQLGLAEMLRGRIEMFAGDPLASEGYLRSATESFSATGDEWLLSTAVNDLAHVLYAQGRYDDTLSLVGEIDELPTAADAEWRIKRAGVQASLLARDGRFDEAEERAREGIAVAAQTDMLWFHADALMDLAEVLRLAGRSAEAADAASEALALYERKGIVPSARRAQALLEELRSQAAL